MMESSVLPQKIAKILTIEALDELFSPLMEEIGKSLKSDRCFLYLRHPDTRWGKAAFCYCRHDHIPDVTTEQWERESASLEQEDPMFAAALACQPSIFIEDVATAKPQVVNREFERKHFGHRALIHAHLCCEGELWGILQPCLFEQPRHWTSSDRQLIFNLIPPLTPLVRQYVTEQKYYK